MSIDRERHWSMQSIGAEAVKGIVKMSLERKEELQKEHVKCLQIEGTRDCF